MFGETFTYRVGSSLLRSFMCGGIVQVPLGGGSNGRGSWPRNSEGIKRNFMLKDTKMELFFFVFNRLH